MIVQQCENCATKGKKAYCNKCILKPDYFDVFRYDPNNDRFGKGSKKLRIKAYTWNDVLEYVKNNLFDDQSQNNLVINCEKDFAYIEERLPGQDFDDNAVKESEKENFLGYKVYLINKDETTEYLTVEESDFCDLTVFISSDGR
jgi:hypothetical protein